MDRNKDRNEDRNEDRNLRENSERDQGRRGGAWSNPDDYYGNRSSRDEDGDQGNRANDRVGGHMPHGAFDEGSHAEREYGDGVYNSQPGTEGQESFGRRPGAAPSGANKAKPDQNDPQEA
jgi:hypothetical protein